MINLNQMAVAEFLKAKKDRLEKIRNFVEISQEIASDVKDYKDYYVLTSVANEAQKEANEIYKEIELVEYVNNAIRTKEAGGFMAQFTELSSENIAKANKLVANFIAQTEL